MASITPETTGAPLEVAQTMLDFYYGPDRYCQSDRYCQPDRYYGTDRGGMPKQAEIDMGDSKQ